MKKELLHSLALLQAHSVITGKERSIIDFFLLNHSNTHQKPVKEICSTLKLSNFCVYHLLRSLEKKGILKNNAVQFSKISSLGTKIAKYCKNNSNFSQEEFSEKWEKHNKELLYFLLSRNVKPEDAEDILQESYFKAWKNISSYKKGTNFRAWIFFITKNTMRDHFRKRTSFQYDENRDSQKLEADPSQYSLLEEEEIHLQKYIQLLPEEYQEVLHLSIHSIPYKEIAVLLDLPIGTIKSRIHRAKLLLKESIQSQ